MNNVERLITRLVDEHKLTGEEAVTLIKAIHQIDQNKSSTIDDLLKQLPHKNNSLDNRWRYPHQQNYIIAVNDETTTVTYQLCGGLSFFI